MDRHCTRGAGYQLGKTARMRMRVVDEREGTQVTDMAGVFWKVVIVLIAPCLSWHTVKCKLANRHCLLDKLSFSSAWLCR